jgi:hypothetical protein
MLSSKAKKKMDRLFFWPFWAEGVICGEGRTQPTPAHQWTQGVLGGQYRRLWSL